MKLRGNNDLILGLSGNGNGNLVLPSSARATHIYCCGATGTGKSKFLEHLIRQDIKKCNKSRCGLLVIDPHGSLYDSLMRWLAWNQPYLDRPVIPIDLRRDDWIVAYNVLRQRQHADPAVIISQFVQAMSYVWGAGGTNATPLFERWASTVLSTLLERNLTLVDAEHLIDGTAKDTRRAITCDLNTSMAARNWRFADTLSAKDFENQIGSTVNRLQRFLATHTLRLMFGQDRVSLDLSQCLQDGNIILVSLATEGNRISQTDAHLFGTLLLNDLWVAARQRGKKDVTPFYVYVDECQEFITPTIAENLDQARGFGLHLTLAHQYPKQLLNKGAHGQQLYDSILVNARTKIVFGMEGEENLRPLAQSLFMGAMSPDKVKHELYGTKVVGYREDQRTSYGYSESSGSGSTAQSGYASGEGIGGTFQFSGDLGKRTSRSRSTSEFSSNSDSRSYSASESSGYSQTTSAMLMPIMGQELTSIQFESLDEQLFRAMEALHTLAHRRFIASIVGSRAPRVVTTPDVADPPQSDLVDDYIEALYQRWPFALRAEVAREQLAKRQASLTETVLFTGVDEPAIAARPISDNDILPPMPSIVGRDDSIHYQERDFVLLRALFESRIMTIDHMAKLFFEGRKEAAKKRVQRLKAAGLLGERARRVNEPSIHFLTTKAFKLLSTEGFLSGYPALTPSALAKRPQVSALTLAHELEVMDIKAALCSAIAKTTSLKVVEFRTWPMLNQFKVRRPGAADMLVKPDGFVRICEEKPAGGLSEHTFFVENDRGTESLATLAIKARVYASHYRGGGMALKHGQPASSYRSFPFRVLFVLKSDERRDNIAKRLLENNPPTLTQVWLTTIRDFVADPLGSVWVRPLDFRGSQSPKTFQKLIPDLKQPPQGDIC
jgi:hypothetical protein